ncbi:MAG TPA: hypothetical protein VM223_15760 [Planctomycetota bacterium]|nr:hypothetical protein [Planctomycetota bacterium]
MAEKSKCAEIEVLNILCRAGMNGIRQAAITEQMGCAASSTSVYLKTLMAAGWAAEKDGRYTVGPQLQAAYRLWQESWLAAQQTLVDLAHQGDPQPPTDGPSEGVDFVTARKVGNVEQKLDQLADLLRRHIGTDVRGQATG